VAEGSIRSGWAKTLASLLLALLLACAAGGASAGAADELRARFAAVQQQTPRNLFDRPLYLQSTETAEQLRGDVHALIDEPFELVRQTLTRPDNWCNVLILHLNVQYCRATRSAAQDLLVIGSGRKTEQPLADLYWLRFAFSTVATGDEHFSTRLLAPAGPLGTRDYRIVVEAAPYAPGRTLLHLTYSYAQGTAARWAMQAYLGTLGSGKLGFSSTGQRPDGQPQYVGGVRAVLERNTLRYYLAIESSLAAQALPPSERLNASLQSWFSATERYPLQLHEMERGEYIEMKLRAVKRQMGVEAPAPK
jgi:hypothetical protein